MSGLVESALAILASSASRTRIASENIGNMTTPGYRKRAGTAATAFGSLTGQGAPPEAKIGLAQGSLRATGNQFDLAIHGEGFFVIASEHGGLHYTRQGHFQRAGDGRLVTAGGHALQQAGGGDIMVRHDRVEILTDGTVLEDGQPIGQIALAAPIEARELIPVSGSVFTAPQDAMREVSAASIRQGMLEGSNVSLGEEMLTLMTATRQAETGARLVQVYDELMGRAFTTLGQRG